MKATTIGDVLSILTGIIADTTSRRDPLGYFAALYRQVTLEVKNGIVAGSFDDGPRMSGFDASFANRYFAAYETYTSGGTPTRSWQFAFDRVRTGKLIILQNLLLGINAHVNLDLGVVTGTKFRGSALSGFHADFDHLNEILASLIPRVRAVIEQFSPRIGELTELADDAPELALRFSVEAARDDAWRIATLLSVTPSTFVAPAVELIDGKAKLVGRVVADQPEPVASIVRHIRAAESTDVAAIITALDSVV
ncbi:conserved hypothetical protein [Rhodococcus sp. RD6.2]|uniref:DUF5995 family protein n=1 Tax=Rhodococcus sp. RD6.2 TaxID=260936 RepID=UPI00063B7B34|nr:DUF5995 family protein [Rhodococcus sp. RD6.2]CRK54188.1 conserved hypothetical protein [Rhodococcus sp. RD6.2]